MVISNINKKTTKESARESREPKRSKAVDKETKSGREAIDPPRKSPTRIGKEGSVKPPAAQIRKPTREEVARRAYDIWTSQGCPNGVETENWLSAEQELLRESVE